MLHETKKEFKERQKKMDMIWYLFKENDYDAEKTCRECPFHEEREVSDLCYCCRVWE